MYFYCLVIVVLLSFPAAVYGGSSDAKIIRLNGQTYKMWTDDKGVRRIDPVYLVKGKGKSAPPAAQQKTQASPPKEVKEVAVTTDSKDETDAGSSVVVDMDYEACRQSLARAEGAATIYNVIFDYPKGRKLTVLMLLDTKTVEMKCQYGTRVTTTWE